MFLFYKLGQICKVSELLYGFEKEIWIANSDLYSHIQSFFRLSRHAVLHLSAFSLLDSSMCGFLVKLFSQGHHHFHD